MVVCPTTTSGNYQFSRSLSFSTYLLYKILKNANLQFPKNIIFKIYICLKIALIDDQSLCRSRFPVKKLRMQRTVTSSATTGTREGDLVNVIHHQWARGGSGSQLSPLCWPDWEDWAAGMCKKT